MSDVATRIQALIDEQIVRLQIVGAPDPGQWTSFIDAVGGELRERERRAEALEAIATASTVELSRTRRSLARQYADLEALLDVLANAVKVFHEAVDGDRGALTQALGMARHRFSLHLNAEWGSETLDHEVAGTSIRTLQESLVRLSGAIADLVQDSAAMASTRKELELAGAVQQMLVPPPQGIEIPGARVFSWFEPAAHCGGDWWTAHPLTDSSGLLLVGDVTGHGAPSAIITGAVKGACDLARMGMGGSLRPSQLLRMLNRVIAEAAHGEYMMTSVALLVTPSGTPRVLMANAGHQPPWLLRNRELTVVQGQRESPLGAQAAFNYTEMAIHAEPGDLLVLQTDGIAEAESPKGAELTDKNVRALCRAHAHLGGEGLRDKLREAVHRHLAGTKQQDDITLVVVELL